eukprot:TRINITY_DN48778_c0_g1_i1.p3 TRINITY_DN48778_c0_g1~~TRINITY_DN48778_c0_g1_i1.p3  ORF type:complete len:100 (-),score=40.80 TRINITY_DN48778_c0_g1_i1:82-381(-)
MCIRDRYQRRVHGGQKQEEALAKEELRLEVEAISEASKSVDYDDYITLLHELKEVKNELQEKDREICGLKQKIGKIESCLLYTSPSPRDLSTSRMPSSA